jgi:GMP synthase-like glutamine amidotransferase
MKAEMVAGYSPSGSPTGVGPFKDLFPKTREMKLFAEFEFIDILILWGGADISPSLYKAERISSSGPEEPSERDLYEWELMRRAYANNIPIIGVCRGAQLLCAFAGGQLIQDVDGHRSAHNITTSEGDTLMQPGDHHQMMWPYDVNHKLLAWSEHSLGTTYSPEGGSSDDLEARRVKEPEIVWFPDIKGLAIQGHPEWGTYEGSKYIEYCLKLIKEYCL